MAAQLFERQARIQEARAIEIAVAPTVQDMADIEPADPAGKGGIADDIDRAAVAEQMIKIGSVRKLVDPLQIDQEKPAKEFGGSPEGIQEKVPFSRICADPP